MATQTFTLTPAGTGVPQQFVLPKISVKMILFRTVVILLVDGNSAGRWISLAPKDKSNQSYRPLGSV